MKPRRLLTVSKETGMPGAETRQARMVGRLTELGWSVDEDSIFRPTKTIVQPRRLGSAAIVAALVARHLVSRSNFFTFDPAIFVGLRLNPFLIGKKGFFFCRNDQIYQKEEIGSFYGVRERTLIPYLTQLFCLLFADKYVVQTSHAKLRLIKRFYPFKVLGLQNKIVVLHNDVHVKYTETARKTISDEFIDLAFISNPAWYKKGFPKIVELAEFSNLLSKKLRLHIMGEGPDFDLLLQKLDGLNVTYKAYGRTDWMSLGLPDIDFVIAPSVVDHFPNLLIECAACSVPLLLSDIEAHTYIYPQHPGFFNLENFREDLINLLNDPHTDSLKEEIIESQKKYSNKLKSAWSSSNLEVVFG